MMIGQKVYNLITQAIGIPTVAKYTAKIINTGEVKVALDIGCGFLSQLTRFHPNVITVGIDAHEEALNDGKAGNAHNHYVLANLLTVSLNELQDMLEAETGRRTFDLVTAFGVIEHLPKNDGWKFLDRCEKLSEKYILLDTPNGYLPQGPEFGNPFQKHLSGWYPHDFRGLGYTVYGTGGTHYLRGYMGEKKFAIPGLPIFDQILARLLLTNRFPQHGFNITAIKDVRGVPARYKTRKEYDDSCLN